MSENTEPTPKKSTLGDRMSDISGIKIYRDGKWIPVSTVEKPEDKPKK